MFGGVQSLVKKVMPKKMTAVHWAILIGLVLLLTQQHGSSSYGSRKGMYACPQNYSPVLCGGKRYSNKCWAEQDGCTGPWGNPYNVWGNPGNENKPVIEYTFDV